VGCGGSDPFPAATLRQVWSASAEAGVRRVVCLLAITNRDRATGIVADFFRALHERSFTCSEVRLHVDDSMIKIPVL